MDKVETLLKEQQLKVSELAPDWVNICPFVCFLHRCDERPCRWHLVCFFSCRWKSSIKNLEISSWCVFVWILVVHVAAAQRERERDEGRSDAGGGVALKQMMTLEKNQIIALNRL